MAHVEKHKKNVVNVLLQHNTRETKEDGSHYKHSNKDIDVSMSDQNIDMMSDLLTAKQRFEKRCNEVYIYGRGGVKDKETVYLASWVVTMPGDIKDDDTARFFQCVHEFLCERYGHDNAIASNVHLDETRPHLHFDFMPVLYDAKKKRDKLCCKQVLTKHDLQTFHHDLNKYVDDKLGYHCSILTGERSAKAKDEREQNYTVSELKARTKERVKSLSLEIEELKAQIAEVELQDSKDTLEDLKRINAEADEFMRINHIREKQDLMKVYNENKELTLENDTLRSQNIALNDKIEKQDYTINVLNAVFNTNVNLLVQDIQKVAVCGENVKFVIQNAAAQLVRVVHSAFEEYARAGYIR